MSGIETGAKSKQNLPVVPSVVLAYRNVLGKPRQLFVISALPFLANFVIGGTFLLASRRDDPLAPLYLLLLMIPLSYLGLAWTRHSLREKHPTLVLDRPWGAAYARSLACHVLWIPFLYSALLVATYLAVLLADGLLGRGEVSSDIGWFILIGITTVVILVGAAVARVFLALVLVEARRPASLLAAWRLGRGLGLRLGAAISLLMLSHIALATLCLFFLIAAAAVIFESLLFPDITLLDTFYFHYQIALLVISTIILPFGTIIAEALFAEFMVIAFRSIANWKGPREDILERFD